MQKLEAMILTGKCQEALSELMGQLDSTKKSLLQAEAHHYLGEFEEALRFGRRALRSASEQEDESSKKMAVAQLILSLIRKGDARSLEEALGFQVTWKPGAYSTEADARLGHAHGRLFLQRGHLEEARRHLLLAHHGLVRLGLALRGAAVLDTLGGVMLRMGDSFRASRCFEESIAIKDKEGDLVGISISSGNLGRLLLGEGHAREAMLQFEKSQQAAERVGDPYGKLVAQNGLALTLIEEGDMEGAAKLLQRARREASRCGYKKLVALLMKDTAVLEERRGDLKKALVRTERARQLFEEEGNLEGVGYCTAFKGKLLHKMGATSEAATALEKGIEVLGKTKREDLLAEAWLRLAETNAARDAKGRTKALKDIDVAERLALSSGSRRLAEEIRAARTALEGREDQSHVVALQVSHGLGGMREYVLETPLGKGGQGTAWSAIDSTTRMPVVVKRLPLSSEERSSDIDQALREYQAAMEVNHANVVRVLASDLRRNEFIIVMERLEGPSLDRRIAAQDYNLETAWSWIEDASSALESLHARGILHRDVKPANLVLRGDGRAVLIDFGLSEFGVQTRKDDRFAGTLPYMAPECLQGERSFRSDLFSLGILSVELLTGVNPIRMESKVATAALILDSQRLKRAIQAVALPPSLGRSRSNAIMKWLSVDPRLRT